MRVSEVCPDHSTVRIHAGCEDLATRRSDASGSKPATPIAVKSIAGTRRWASAAFIGENATDG